MAGVMLLFAFSMSFVVNLVENKINPEDEMSSLTGETDKMTE